MYAILTASWNENKCFYCSWYDDFTNSLLHIMKLSW